MIDVYTDITLIPKTQEARAACLLLDQDTYLGCYTDELYGNNTLSLEIQGVLLSVRHAREISSDAHIRVYCDHANAIKVLQQRSSAVGRLANYAKLLSSYDEINVDTNIEYLLIKGHQYSMNPNKFTDYIAGNSLLIERSRQ